MPRPQMAPGPRKPKDAKKTFARVLSYLKYHKAAMIVIVVSIILSSLAGVAGGYFLKPLVNDITQFIGQESPDLSGFIGTLIFLAVIYLIGAVCSYTYQRLMINVSTGVLRQIRIDLFTHMQALPLRYYDTHTHGELMSRYTSDTDTLRELISGSIPQLISSSKMF